MARYLAPDGRLRSELVLRDAQSGFAGVTADVWRVAPDGTCRVTRELDGRVVEPERTGRLTPEQIAELAEVLAEQDLKTLPAEMGQPAEVNPRQITLRFGDAASTLHLTPGAELRDAVCGAAPQSEEGRLLGIATAITDALAQGGPEPAERDCSN